ncbi:MAG: tetratricopeptide repeat protein [Betaproteobacteria bacterium]
MKRWRNGLAIGMFAATAWAAGGDGAGGGGGGDTEVRRDPSYQAGVVAIERQDWQRAIQMFETSLRWDRFNADAHNWLGYAYRNAGNMNRAFQEYELALKLDPAHIGAHEYLGEAYVIAKDMPNAKAHLAALEKLCGRNCPQYRDLQEAIEKAGG